MGYPHATTARSASGAGALLELDAEGVQGEGDEVVLADEERHLDQLTLVVAGGERGPGLVADPGGVVQLVGGPQQGGVERVPAVGVGAEADPLDLLVGEAGGPAQLDVVGPLVGRVAA